MIFKAIQARNLGERRRKTRGTTEVCVVLDYIVVTKICEVEIEVEKYFVDIVFRVKKI